MPDNNTIEYKCDKCGYNNLWTRDEILQKGRKVTLLGDDEDIYSLPCKNPKLNCDGRRRIAVKREN